MKSITITLNLEPVELQYLRDAAQRMNLNIDAFMKNLLAQHIKQFPSENSNSKVDFMGIVNIGSSGAEDISTNHDQYLGDAIANDHLR